MGSKGTTVYPKMFNLDAPFQMGGQYKSPVAKELVGDQDQLPDELKEAIGNSPAEQQELSGKKQRLQKKQDKVSAKHAKEFRKEDMGQKFNEKKLNRLEKRSNRLQGKINKL
jgi:hypothetical protein